MRILSCLLAISWFWVSSNAIYFKTKSNAYNALNNLPSKFKIASRSWNSIPISWCYKQNEQSVNYSPNTITYLIHSAFNEWSKTGLTFDYHRTCLIRKKHDPDYEKRTKIVISFEKRHHGDSYDFVDGSGVIAHAFYPVNGAIHIDASFKFDLTPPGLKSQQNGVRLYNVLLHEIGHSIGLEHSSVEESIMFPYYTDEKTALKIDDIIGIREIYNKKLNITTPKWGFINNTKYTQEYLSRRKASAPPVSTTLPPKSDYTTKFVQTTSTHRKTQQPYCQLAINGISVMDNYLVVFMQNGNIWYRDRMFTSMDLFGITNVVSVSNYVEPGKYVVSTSGKSVCIIYKRNPIKCTQVTSGARISVTVLDRNVVTLGGHFYERPFDFASLRGPLFDLWPNLLSADSIITYKGSEYAVLGRQYKTISDPHASSWRSVFDGFLLSRC